MQAVILVDQTRVADVPDRSPSTGMALGTTTKKVIVVYTVPEIPNMTRTVQVNHPATIEEIKAAVQACAANCMGMETAADQYKSLLTGNNTFEL